jgi:hypothetical protein
VIRDLEMDTNRPWHISEDTASWPPGSALVHAAHVASGWSRCKQKRETLQSQLPLL